VFIVKGKDFQKELGRIKFSFVNWSKGESVEIKKYTSTQLMFNENCDFECEGILTKDYDIIDYSIENNDTWIRDNTVILKISLSENEFNKLIA